MQNFAIVNIENWSDNSMQQPANGYANITLIQLHSIKKIINTKNYLKSKSYFRETIHDEPRAIRNKN